MSRRLNIEVPRASQGGSILAESALATMPESAVARRGAMFDAIPAGAKYAAIMADPPIPFKAYSPKGEGRCPQAHYRCTNFDDLAALPVHDIAAANAFLFLWVPLRSVNQVVPLMAAWGFCFSGSAFVWCKLNKSGVGWFMGNGFTTRKNVEICWLGRRGKPQRRSMAVRELIVAPRREHSRKPDEVYERIEALCAGPYLELYARQQWPGWTCLGDEAERFGP
jgi:N6-adenosine-specific RNA methylase IME4